MFSDVEDGKEQVGRRQEDVLDHFGTVGYRLRPFDPKRQETRDPAK